MCVCVCVCWGPDALMYHQLSQCLRVNPRG